MDKLQKTHWAVSFSNFKPWWLFCSYLAGVWSDLWDFCLLSFFLYSTEFFLYIHLFINNIMVNLENIFLIIAYLPSRRSLRGPYLSMTIPSGRVMAERRKEPTVNARFSISSCSLQISQPFILSGPSIGTRGFISTPSPRPTTPLSLS